MKVTQLRRGAAVLPLGSAWLPAREIGLCSPAPGTEHEVKTLTLDVIPTSLNDHSNSGSGQGVVF